MTTTYIAFIKQPSGDIYNDTVKRLTRLGAWLSFGKRNSGNEILSVFRKDEVFDIQMEIKDLQDEVSELSLENSKLKFIQEIHRFQIEALTRKRDALGRYVKKS